MIKFRCPICKFDVEKGAEHFPFCCDRCRLIDLGNWADGSYAIPAEPSLLDDEENQEKIH